ncbi:MAG: hypothetical protein KME09_00170 [Pleurocapsa minor HA4230-MV1]|jgi:hypothetical protein|nr:hypothetical protein [Pleurocapsa minor HA4230-MV1]
MNIESLKISEKVKKLIINDIKLISFLTIEEKKYPFPPNFIPQKIEIRLNNLLCATLNIDDDEQILTNKTNFIKQPEIIDWRFDNECGLFIISGIEIINRTENLEIFKIIDFNITKQ